MVHEIRLTRLVLALLFLMNGIRDSCALASQDLVNKNELVVNEDKVISAHKELPDGFGRRNMGLEGRKMVVLRKEIDEKEQQGISKEIISGKEINKAIDKSFGGLQDQLNNQKKLMTNHEEIQGIAPKGEMQRLLKATKEIVNLMNKDYKGMDRPRRKPPINNHVPIH